MTKRAQTKKGASWKTISRERVGDYNNDGVRVNNEDDKSGNDKMYVRRANPFERGVGGI